MKELNMLEINSVNGGDPAEDATNLSNNLNLGAAAAAGAAVVTLWFPPVSAGFGILSAGLWGFSAVAAMASTMTPAAPDEAEQATPIGG